MEKIRVKPKIVRISFVPLVFTSAAFVGWMLKSMKTGSRSSAAATIVRMVRSRKSRRRGERSVMVGMLPEVIFCSLERKRA